MFFGSLAPGGPPLSHFGVLNHVLDFLHDLSSHLFVHLFLFVQGRTGCPRPFNGSIPPSDQWMFYDNMQSFPYLGSVKLPL